MLKVVCFKWEPRDKLSIDKLSLGVGRYTSIHVNRLHRAVSENLTIPHEFICITDDPRGIDCRTIPLWDHYSHLGGCYNRLYVFSEDMRELIGERFICIDLDCVILGSLNDIFSREEDFVIMRYVMNARKKRQKYNGSLFIMNAGARHGVWERLSNPDDFEHFRHYKVGRYVGSDQAWINYVLGDEEALFSETDGVYQYKHIRRTGLPNNAKIVFFAGGRYDPSTCSKPWARRYWHIPAPQETKEEECGFISSTGIFS